MIKKFKREVVLSAIIGTITLDNVKGLYELHRFVFSDDNITKKEQIDARWSEMVDHLIKLYPQLSGTTYDPQLEMSFAAWNQAQDLLMGAELPICQIGQELAQELEKPLLYYDRYERMTRHFNGSPIHHFKFKNLKTGEEVTLGECFYNQELANTVGGHYYADITEATADYDILWKLSDNKISPVAPTFAEVEAEYQRMLADGVAPNLINQAMMNQYKVNQKHY